MAPCRSKGNAASARLNAQAAAYKQSQGAASARLNAEAAAYKRKHVRTRSLADGLRYQAQAASLRRASKHSGGLAGGADVWGRKSAVCGG